MEETIYYAEITIRVKDGKSVHKLEMMEDSIFDAQEALPDEERVIDEDQVVIDDEAASIYVISRDFDDIEILKTELGKFLKANLTSEFEFSADIYKNSFMETMDRLD